MTKTLWSDFTGPVQGSAVEHNGFQVYMDYPIHVVKGEQLFIRIEDARGAWEQGVHLKLRNRGKMEYQGQTDSYLYVWQTDRPPETLFKIKSTKDGMLWVWNVWLTGTPNASPRAHMHNSGMVVEGLPNGWRFRCSDGYGLKPLSSLRTPRDFNNLVFRIERVSHPDGHGELEGKK